MRDFGWIKPDADGKFRWPFREMRDGDCFHVDTVARPRGAVAQMVSNRTYQLDRKFSMVTERDKSVTVYCGFPPQRSMLPQTLSYGRFTAWLAMKAKLRVDDLPWPSYAMPRGKDTFIPADMSQYVRNRRLFMRVEPWAFSVEVKTDGFLLTSLDPEMRLSQYRDMVTIRDELLAD